MTRTRLPVGVVDSAIHSAVSGRLLEQFSSHQQAILHAQNDPYRRWLPTPAFEWLRDHRYPFTVNQILSIVHQAQNETPEALITAFEQALVSPPPTDS